MFVALADEVVAAEGARFGMPEIQHGMPSPIGMAILAARTGARAPSGSCSSARRWTQRRRTGLGLVDEIAAAERLKDRAIERARALGSLDGRAFSINKAFAAGRLRNDLHAARRFIDAT
jgi:enoyl-CoA hydratase/carnithine racemase